MRQEGRRVPSTLSKSELERLLDLPSMSARRKYLSFLFGCEMTKVNQQQKKEERMVAREERLALQREENKDKDMVYGLGHNSIFLKIYETTINLWHNNKLTRAMQFSQKLVIDCSYDEHMSYREADNCAKQLCFTFAINRLHDQPFDLHYCNLDIQTKSGKKLSNHMPTMFNPEFPMNAHKKSYIDLFDKDRLVYLTPHCKNELQEYNHDDIYIVGAMVDKANNDPISLAKAKKQGLRMAKLPLDRYLDWGIGGKSLTINQMIEILLEMRMTNDWEKALRFVPRRKLYKNNFEQSHQLKFAQKNRFKGKFTMSKEFLSETDDDDEQSRRPNNFNKSPHNEQRTFKERKHFEKIFDIDSWASKSNKKNNTR